MKTSDAYIKGRAGKQIKNPYNEDSIEFDEFEKGRGQFIKRSRPDQWGELDDEEKKSKIATKTKAPNAYSIAKGR